MQSLSSARRHHHLLPRLDLTAPPAELLASIDALVETVRVRHSDEFSMVRDGS